MNFFSSQQFFVLEYQGCEVKINHVSIEKFDQFIGHPVVSLIHSTGDK